MAHRPPLKAKRDAIEQDVIAAIRAQGISVYPTDMPVDLICGFKGVTYLVEVKSGPKATTTDAQKKFTASWRGHYQIIRSIAEADSWAKSVHKCGGIQFDGTINERKTK